MDLKRQQGLNKYGGLTLQEFCEYISNSSIVPNLLKGKPVELFLIITLGEQLGLNYRAAIKYLYYNKKSEMWGTVLTAMLYRHPDFISIKEYFEDENTAVCVMYRRNGKKQHKISYTHEEAIQSGLALRAVNGVLPIRYNKRGEPYETAWDTSLKAMLQKQARRKCMNVLFPDLQLICYDNNLPIIHDDLDKDLLEEILDDKFDNEILDEVDLEQKIESEIKAQNSLKQAPKSQDLSQEISNLIERQKAKSKNITLENDDIEQKDNSYTKLMTLITDYKIPVDLVNKWCDKAKVDSIDGLNDYQMQGCIKLIENKYIEVEHER